MAGLQPIRGPVVLADGALGGLDQLRGTLGSDQVASVVAQLGQPFRRGAGEVVRGGAFGKECGRQHAVQPAHVSGELGETTWFAPGKAQTHKAVELARAVVEVLPDAVAMADQLAQRLGRGIVQLRRLGTLLKSEAGNAGGVGRVGLGALQRAVLEAPGLERVEQDDAVPGGHEGSAEVLPIVAGRLHGDQHRRRPEQAQQRVAALPVLGDRHWLAERHALHVQAREHMALGRDVDPSKHGILLPSVGLRASEPAPMPALVQARTPARQAPPDTVRAKNAGRGRQSHCRGQCPHRNAATLSQRPPHHTSREVRR